MSDIARHVIRCQITLETMVQNALDDEASNDCQVLSLGRIPQIACTMEEEDWATAMSRDLSYYWQGGAG